MIVRRAMKNDSVVAGGGAIEVCSVPCRHIRPSAAQMELSKFLRAYARTIAGKQQLIIAAFAKALEVIPRQLCENAGFDATNILNKLRQTHAQGSSTPFASARLIVRRRRVVWRGRVPRGHCRQLRGDRLGAVAGQDQRADGRGRVCRAHPLG